MAPAMGDDRDRRRTLESQSLDVPVGTCEDFVTGRGERREVRHRRPGHEADARAPGQTEQLHEPVRGHLFGDGGGGREDVEPGVLVPCARQPVGTERSRQASTDDKSEIARAGRRDEPGVCVAIASPSTTASGSVGPSGSGAARRAARSTGGPTGRVASDAR